MFAKCIITHVSHTETKEAVSQTNENNRCHFQCFQYGTYLKAEHILRACISNYGLFAWVGIFKYVADSYQFGILNLENTSKRFRSFD